MERRENTACSVHQVIREDNQFIRVGLTNCWIRSAPKAVQHRWVAGPPVEQSAHFIWVRGLCSARDSACERVIPPRRL